MIYFTSDTHFGHENVIKYSKRPFLDKNHMDEGLIAKWNERVKPGDTVYHIGDFFFCQEKRALEILDRLNGQKFLVYGNHDKLIKKSPAIRERFVKCADYLELTVPDRQLIVMSHYAMITWNKAHHGSWMIHGHSHGGLRYPFEAKIHDVGVDPNGYAPISLDELRKIMDGKNFTSVDHHGEE